MSHLNGRIIKNKLGLLNLAAKLGNTSRACKVMGTSRDTFYRYQGALEEGGRCPHRQEPQETGYQEPGG